MYILLTCTQNDIGGNERSSARMRGRSPPRIGVNADVVRVSTTCGTSTVDNSRRWNYFEVWAEDGFIIRIGVQHCSLEGGGFGLLINRHLARHSRSGFGFDRVGIGIIDCHCATKIIGR